MEGSGRSCGVGKHETRKFAVNERGGYIMCSDGQGQCRPVLETKDFSLEQLKIIKEKELKPSQWEIEIKRINEGDLPDWLPKKKLRI